MSPGLNMKKFRILKKRKAGPLEQPDPSPPLICINSCAEDDELSNHISADLCVYGASPGGIMAAISAARSGLSVILLEPTGHIGGMLTSGLNATDAPVPSLITGLPREYFSRCGLRYGHKQMSIRHEPKVCAETFREMLTESGVRTVTNSCLQRIKKSGSRITSGETNNGKTIAAKWWIDATYEGDLMPLAQISYRVGRESRDEFQESLAGVGRTGLMLGGLSAPIDPFKDGHPLPYLEPYEQLKEGAKDWRVQSYCFRLTLTSVLGNMRPIKAPESYNPENYELFRRLIKADYSNAGIVNTARNDSIRNGYLHIAKLPNGKIDFNSGHLTPTNNPMLTQGWIAASQTGRERIQADFRHYTEGLIWFLRTDPTVPQPIRKIMQEYWYPSDEYSDGFPPALYIREGRRLVGDKVTTLHEVSDVGVGIEKSIGQGAYHLDCKPARWFVNHKGNRAVREGQFFSREIMKFHLPLDLMLPQESEAKNVLVVNAVSASHVAFGSIRMEPTWMTLGSAAGISIAISETNSVRLHSVPSKQVKIGMTRIANQANMLAGIL